MRFATAFWSLLLAGSVGAIGIGFLGGRSIARGALAPAAPRPLQPAPEPVRTRDRVVRALRGENSLENDPDDPDPYGDVDRAVATRPRGWAPRVRDRSRPRIAVVVVGVERSASDVVPLANEPFPLAVVVPPDDETDALRAVRDAGKTPLVACDGADPAAIASLRERGAAGIACSAADPARAARLVAANGRGVVFDDLLAGRALFAAARRARRPALTRDVTVDARDDPHYVDFLFAQALGIAERSGVATVVLHARDGSRRSLERFARRAERDGIALVDLRALAR